METNTTALGTVGTYRLYNNEPGSRFCCVEFIMYGLTFRAVHLVRPRGGVDQVELYTCHPSSWCDDYLKCVDLANPCAAGKRALHLLAVASSDIPSDTAERFALIELS